MASTHLIHKRFASHLSVRLHNYKSQLPLILLVLNKEHQARQVAQSTAMGTRCHLGWILNSHFVAIPLLNTIINGQWTRNICGRIITQRMGPTYFGTLRTISVRTSSVCLQQQEMYANLSLR